MHINMHLNLLVRGPVTAITALLAVATFSSGVFFIALRNTALDCAAGSSTGAACGVDILETVMAAVMGIGAAAGASAIGFTTPTPRRSTAVFRVDGVDVDWASGVSDHKFGVNRTIDNPAYVEWQHNATSGVHRHKTYTKDEHLVMRHDTGFMVPAGRKRVLCKAYFDVSILTDELRSNIYASVPTRDEYYLIASDLFYWYGDHKYESGCVFLAPTIGDPSAIFRLGASCEETDPHPGNCANGDYSYKLVTETV